MNEIHKGDVGTTFRANVVDSSPGVDLSSSTYTSLFFVFRDPANNPSTLTATSFNSASGGVVDFVVATSTTLGTQGAWYLQLIVTAGTNKWHSDVHGFIVHPNL